MRCKCVSVVYLERVSETDRLLKVEIELCIAAGVAQVLPVPRNLSPQLSTQTVSVKYKRIGRYAARGKLTEGAVGGLDVVMPLIPGNKEGGER